MKADQLRIAIREIISEEMSILESNTQTTQAELMKTLKERIKKLTDENKDLKEKLAKSKAASGLKEMIQSEVKAIFENEEVQELFGFNKPATDEQLTAWLERNKHVKAIVDKMDPEKASKWREFVKKNKAEKIKNDEVIQNVFWDPNKNDWSASQPSKGGGQ